METKKLKDDIALQINQLRTYFFTDRGTVKAVDGVDLTVRTGTTFGIVGESGCGKSMTALSILQLVPKPTGRVVSGEVLFQGQDLLKVKKSEMRRIRGNRISMIFQEPMTALNPVLRVGDQIAEMLSLHKGLSKKEAWEKAIELLNLVKIPSPENRIKDYPHQLSGGMRQRAMIAMAISCNPCLVIADEPTTALDVTIQAQILDLINRLKEQIGMSIILITHNMGVIAENVQEIAVMYAGKIVEYASVKDLFRNPLHPYTVGLMKCIPKLGDTKPAQERLTAIPGLVPDLLNLPQGCSFAERCQEARGICRETQPDWISPENGHCVRCLKYNLNAQ